MYIEYAKEASNYVLLPEEESPSSPEKRINMINMCQIPLVAISLYNLKNAKNNQCPNIIKFLTFQTTNPSNKQFLSCLSPLFQIESWYKAFYMKISFIHKQIWFIYM